jgi:hypothetical protein
MSPSNGTYKVSFGASANAEKPRHSVQHIAIKKLFFFMSNH